MTEIQLRPATSTGPDSNGLTRWSGEHVVTVDGRTWTVEAGFFTNKPDLQLYIKPTVTEDAVWVELVDADGNVYRTSIQATGRRPEPWPRTQTIPSGVWTTLEEASAQVFHDTGADATVTVDAEGDVTVSAAMQVRITPEVDYGSWGDDE